MKVGIDDMALYIPNLYLEIEDLAKKRDIPYVKLNKGLGLEQMSLPDAYEDVATMAANAILELIEKNQLDPRSIGRIYLGTESALDGSKPTITYAIDMLVDKLSDQYGTDCFNNCDVADMTFACIGGVDALQNTLDWVRNNKGACGIVVCSDFAKYELDSTGEYTQGAGAIALLIKEDPRLLEIENQWGVATKAVHDFYKPQRRVSKRELLKDVLNAMEGNGHEIDDVLRKLQSSDSQNGLLSSLEKDIVIHKETPVFDGQYSNLCYKDRIKEAFDHFRSLSSQGDEKHITSWKRIVFHLPYAYHGKRIFTQIFAEDLYEGDQWEQFKLQNGIETISKDRSEDIYKNARAISKTKPYRNFVNDKIEKGQRASGRIGNLYTGSIFLSLMSVLECDCQDGEKMEGELLGFFAYGSGSKSKVFEAKINPGWKDVVSGFKVFEKLDARQRINYENYIALHTEQCEKNLSEVETGFYFSHFDMEENREFARNYSFSE